MELSGVIVLIYFEKFDRVEGELECSIIGKTLSNIPPIIGEGIFIEFKQSLDICEEHKDDRTSYAKIVELFERLSGQMAWVRLNATAKLVSLVDDNEFSPPRLQPTGVPVDNLTKNQFDLDPHELRILHVYG